jgi:hypothetical protein
MAVFGHRSSETGQQLLVVVVGASWCAGGDMRESMQSVLLLEPISKPLDVVFGS